jgi:hypothetical protein
MTFLKPLLAPFERLLRRQLLNNFDYWQSLGVHVVPAHFYQPIPNTRELDERIWSRVSRLPGLRLNEDHQVRRLADFSKKYGGEYCQFPSEPTSQPSHYFVNNGSFESVDGEILYCMIRDLKPQRIFEIGSGNSTYLAAQAALKNREEGNPCDLVAFEPYPNEVLRSGFPGLSQLHPVKAQEILLETFDQLRDSDILFIDSSHVLKIGSDVQYLYLEVLPRLREGVVIHVHDVFLPADYPRSWVMDRHIFWNEQYLLQAFLACNRDFEIQWAASYMHRTHPGQLAAAFPSYNPTMHMPGSFWIKRV